VRGYRSREEDLRTLRGSLDLSGSQMLAYCVGYQVSDAVLVYPEPLQSQQPLTVTRPGITVRIHAVGLDLSGDSASFDAACESLVQAVISLAGVRVCAAREVAVGEGERATGAGRSDVL